MTPRNTLPGVKVVVVEVGGWKPPVDTPQDLATATGTPAARAIKGSHKVTETPSL